MGPAGARHLLDRGAVVVLMFVQWSGRKCVDQGFLGKTVAIFDVCSAPAWVTVGGTAQQAVGQQW